MTSRTKVDLTKMTNQGLLMRTHSICREHDRLQDRLDINKEELRECREEARSRTSDLYREVLNSWQEQFGEEPEA